MTFLSAGAAHIVELKQLPSDCLMGQPSARGSLAARYNFIVKCLELPPA